MSTTASPSNASAAKSASSERIAFHSAATPGEVNNLAVFTLVLWLSCVLIGVLGFAFPYARPLPPTPPPEPFIAEQLQVELTREPLPLPDTGLPPPDEMTPPEPVAVAQPSPAIAFALPVEGPTRIVEASRAEYKRPPVTNTPAVAAPPAQTLVYGQGEGKQPEPEYPLPARRQGQEGTVVVRFTVGENGHVVAAETFAPSPWPLLNEAALRVVRARWRFRSGATRVYDVAIRFELSK
jgi:protein TonB